MRGDGEPAERLYGKGGGDGRGMDVLLKWLWGWQGLMQREGQAHSPTKSERNSGVLEGLVRREVRWFGNPSGSRPNFYG